MTKRAAEEYLVHLAAKQAVSPGVRKRPARPTRQKAGSAEPCQPDLYNVRFVVEKSFMDKLDRAAEVSGMGDALHNMVKVFERALDEYLEKNDPERRQERRDKKAAGKLTAEPVAPKNNPCSRTIRRDRSRPAQP